MFTNPMTLLATLGLGAWGKKPAGTGVSAGRGRRVSPVVVERKRFEEEMRGQFLKLKEKGLGIRVFTL